MFKKIFNCSGYIYKLDASNFKENQTGWSAEVVSDKEPRIIFDQQVTWKTKELTNFNVRELQVPIFKDGKCVYDMPTLDEIKDYCAKEIDLLWDEVKRFENPHTYYVDLSEKLWNIKKDLLSRFKNFI